MKRRSSYKVTFFDRHGPDGELHMRRWGYGLMVFGIVCGATFFAGTIAGIRFTPLILLMTLGGAVTLSSITIFGSGMLATAAGAGAKYFTAGGSSTPYEEQFSQEQALVMQRDYAGALACFEQRIAMSPGEPRVRIAAADLYVQHGNNPTRAAELYREVQRLPTVAPGQDVYVSNKIADLYLGPLKAPGKALVEFRRLIERYPDTVTAKNARLALANIKRNLLEDEAPSSGRF